MGGQTVTATLGKGMAMTRQFIFFSNKTCYPFPNLPLSDDCFQFFVIVILMGYLCLSLDDETGKSGFFALFPLCLKIRVLGLFLFCFAFFICPG